MDTIAIKKSVAFPLFHLGITKRLSRGLRDSVIVAYHHVIPENDDSISFLQSGMYVTTKTFERHIRYLSRNYNIIPLDNIGDLQIENACVITFDDGWADNHHHAFPILKHYNAPSTVFLSTRFMDLGEWPWPDRVSYYAAHAPETRFKEMVRILMKGVEASRHYEHILTLKRDMAAEELIAQLKGIPFEKLMDSMANLDFILRSLHENLQAKRVWMTWDEVRELYQGGVSFGAHTHNHVILTNCSQEEAEQEIVSSRDVLSERLGEPVRMFSFPNGDYHKQHVDILKRHKFTHAVTTRAGVLRDSDDLFTMRRFMIHDDMTRTIPMLACKLTDRIPYF